MLAVLIGSCVVRAIQYDKTLVRCSASEVQGVGLKRRIRRVFILITGDVFILNEIRERIIFIPAVDTCLQSTYILMLNVPYRQSLSTHTLKLVNCRNLHLQDFQPTYMISTLQTCHVSMNQKTERDGNRSRKYSR